MPVFQGMVKWQPPARGGSSRMGDLSAYREELEKLLKTSPNQALQVALEGSDRIATIKSRFRRALQEIGQENVALRFRNLYNEEQERRRAAGEKNVEPEKLLVTYTTLAGTANAEPPRPPRRRATARTRT